MTEKIDINLEEKKYILVYNGTKLILGLSHKGQVSTPNINTVEQFDTIQEIVNRGLQLGLQYTVHDVIGAAVDGAALPQAVIDWAKSQDNDISIAYQLDELFP